MPLTFQTLSHGEIPIGFFNIDTDMLLIRNYFFFASDFCSWLSNWSKDKAEIETEVEIYIIHDLNDIGHLMGAISGVLFTGFIGEVYKKFPFPEKRQDFKQKPDGDKNREVIEGIIRKYTDLEKIEVHSSESDGTISIGEYVFNKDQFHEVIGYVWRGGMPRWKDEVRPEYVNSMMQMIMVSEHWLFKRKGP
jgi:hypothetical protein